MAGVMISRSTRRIYLVEEGPNPSSDYFVIPALNNLSIPVTRCHWIDPLPKAQELEQATVIFVRYVPTNWKRLVTQTRASLAEVIYFMDDDLWDTRVTAGLSWRYRLKLARHATLHQRWLRAIKAKLWVSTPWLATRYQALQPVLLWPHRLDDHARVNTPETPQQIQLFYHGSASHRADIEWLYPVIKAVLTRDSQLSVEISGDARTQALYGGLERCTILKPLKWPAYRTLLASSKRHIGLAPAVPHPFNRARSHTKFFDITAAGATGIYAAQGPCQGILEHRQHGLLVDMDPDALIEAILLLAKDHTLRHALYAQAVDKTYALSTS